MDGICLVKKIDTLVPKNDTLVPKNDTYKFQEISINLQLTPNVSSQLSSTLGLVKKQLDSIEIISKFWILLCKRTKMCFGHLEHPWTLNSQCGMDIWWNNHIPSKDLDSSMWNNHENIYTTHCFDLQKHIKKLVGLQRKFVSILSVNTGEIASQF